MKKKILLFCIAFATLSINAQKASIKSKVLKATFEQPEFLKNTKTFSYTLQDDGVYWNYTPTDGFPTLTSITPKLNISGLEQVKENGDLQIIVGFLGSQLKKEQAVIELKGTYNIMLLNKSNQLITSIQETVSKQVVDNPEKFPSRTRDQRNITKARIVTEYVESIIKRYEHLLSGSADLKMPFGEFKKTKGATAEAFNITSQSIVEAIIANPNDTNALDKGITFWNEQLTADFGKKVKDKVKNKVIYANLTSAYLLKKELEKAEASYELVKKNTGFFDTWTLDYKSVFQRFKAFEDLNGDDLPTINVTEHYMYYMTINGGSYTYKDKEPIEFSKIEIESFITDSQSGIVSLDAIKKPKIFIYENGVKTLRHFSDGKNKITTTDGKEIIFKERKGVYKPFVKQKDGTYKLLQ